MEENEYEGVRYLDFDDHLLFICTPFVVRVVAWSRLTEDDNLTDYYPLAYLWGGIDAGFSAVHGDGTTRVVTNNIGQLRVYVAEPGAIPVFKLGLYLVSPSLASHVPC